MILIKRNVKNILIGLLLLWFIISLIVIYRLATKKENSLNNVTGTVIVADSKYVIIETEEQDYLIKNIKGTYKIGDEVKFLYYDDALSKDDSPKTINDINDEELIKTEVIEDEKIIDNNSQILQNNTDNSNNSIKNESSTNINKIENITGDKESDALNNNSIKENTDADIQVLSYFNNLKSDFDDNDVKSNVKSGFITVIDFLFYKGEIKGHTFSELSNSAKLKVLSLALYFDTKIEKYFPGYKESITSTTSKIYTNVKEEIVTLYLDLTTKICMTDKELCINAKKGFGELKEKFGLTWSLIKDISNDGLTNLKNWYEIWSGK